MDSKDRKMLYLGKGEHDQVIKMGKSHVSKQREEGEARWRRTTAKGGVSNVEADMLIPEGRATGIWFYSGKQGL